MGRVQKVYSRRFHGAPFDVTGATCATFGQRCVLRDLMSWQGQWIRRDSSHCRGCQLSTFLATGTTFAVCAWIWQIWFCVAGAMKSWLGLRCLFRVRRSISFTFGRALSRNDGRGAAFCIILWHHRLLSQFFCDSHSTCFRVCCKEVLEKSVAKNCWRRVL